MAAGLETVLFLFNVGRVKGLAVETPSEEVTRRESKVETKTANMIERENDRRRVDYFVLVPK